MRACQWSVYELLRQLLLILLSYVLIINNEAAGFCYFIQECLQQMKVKEMSLTNL